MANQGSNGGFNWCVCLVILRKGLQFKDIQRIDWIILLIRFIDKKCSANENDEIRITTTNLVGAH